MPSTDWMRLPIAAPKTTKYSTVDTTGDSIDCMTVRKKRVIS